MKVVLFCGGQGLRLREYNESVPKPMAPIGLRPVLWHVMRFYAHHGHGDFVLCLGYKAEVIKKYFLEYDEAISNDFVLADGGRSIEMLTTDIQGWRITFADTGLQSLIGQRLRAVRKYVEGEELFLASYGDCLTDAPIDRYIEDFRKRDAVAGFLAVRPSYTFHIVDPGEDGRVRSINHVRHSDIWINGGYFILRPEIFDYLNEGEDLVEDALARLIAQRRVLAYSHKGYWSPADTVKERAQLEEMYHQGRCPWMVWDPERSGAAGNAGSAPGLPATVVPA